MQSTLTGQGNGLDVAYYLMGYAALEKGQVQFAAIYLTAALEASSNPLTACAAQSEKSCMGINVPAMTGAKLQEIFAKKPDFLKPKVASANQ